MYTYTHAQFARIANKFAKSLFIDFTLKNADYGKVRNLIFEKKNSKRN